VKPHQDTCPFHLPVASETEYIERMHGCRPFRYFGLTPQWRPGRKDIEGFIHDEVVRQGHDPRVKDDGGVRVDGMRMAWEYATAVAATRLDPTVDDILAIGALIEPKKNGRGFRDGNVTIAGRLGAPPEAIPLFVKRLVDALPIAAEQYRIGAHPEQMRPDTFKDDVARIRTADDWYLAFEYVHPFFDGNGRTGKVLHNWLMFTLDDPVLVADYFGGGNP